ncbi:hypothetical protein [Foetidibacter luteolus]|uniref:hypothetical protein n=1 Tax=Foetidibacter luteolus TaxID=2608880 RepID=UPI00129B5BBA|nr:hypothetical protein [Foetidibacter luteolus]
MKCIFTICSNNYLAQASILGKSLQQFEPGVAFFIFLCDEKNSQIDYAALPANEVVPVEDIEPELHNLVLKYNIIELNTCLKPTAIEYLFTQRKATNVLYLDPDIKLYAPLTELYSEFQNFSILLTPHIYTPVPIDDKKPSENTFLVYGLYNLGFIGLKNDSEANRLVAWWKEQTYKRGYFATAIGQFVDQLPINHVPVFFKGVKVLEDRGLNMAPWNLHERSLKQVNGSYYLNNGDKLIFFHFSSFMVDKNELPLMHYDRYKLEDRPDLKTIYAEYNEELKAAGYFFYRQFTSSYSAMKEEHDWQQKPLLKRLFKRRK